MAEGMQVGAGEDPKPSEAASDVVRRNLQRVLASEAFNGSRRSGLLLETIIEAYLQGRTEELKEHKLAQQFFPGSNGFDSSSFYKLRGVQKRMRVRLQGYYRTEGKYDDIQITFGSGVYVPELTWQSSGKVVNLPEEVTLTPVERPQGEESGEAAQPARAIREYGPEEEIGARHSRRRRRKSNRYGWAIAGAVVMIPVLAGVGLLFSTKTDVLAPLPAFNPARRVTQEGELALDPSLGADGRRLVYASDRNTNGNLNIWMADLEASGSAPRRITRGSVDDTQPSISPDGSVIVYYSQAEPAGVWAIDVRSGTPRLLAEGGRRPRISPDGKLVAFWKSTPGSVGVESTLHVVPISGGTPTQLAAELGVAEHPTWSPDGKRILFLGRPKRPALASARETTRVQPPDWWVVEVDGSGLKRTRSLPEGASDITFGPPTSWTPFTNRILADSMQSAVRQPIAVSLSPSFERLGQTENLQSPGFHNGQLYYAERRIASAKISVTSQLAMLPVDSSGHKAGPLKLQTQKDGGNEFSPTLSRDGSWISFVAERQGTFNAYIRNLHTKQERRASNLPRGWSPVYSRDGRYLAVLYPMAGRPGTAGGSGAIEIHSPSGVSKPHPCDRCDRLIGISNDGTEVLYMARNPNNPAWVGKLHVPTGRHSTLVGHPNIVFSADWSPDGRKIVFSSRLPDLGPQILIVDSSGDPEAQAVPLAGANDGDKPAFSADGRLIYFLSNRDKFVCLYALPLDGSYRPAGEPFAVEHFHQRRLSLDSVPTAVQRINVTPNMLTFTAQTVESSVWVAEAR